MWFETSACGLNELWKHNNPVSGSVLYISIITLLRKDIKNNDCGVYASYCLWCRVRTTFAWDIGACPEDSTFCLLPKRLGDIPPLLHAWPLVRLLGMWTMYMFSKFLCKPISWSRNLSVSILTSVIFDSWVFIVHAEVLLTRLTIMSEICSMLEYRNVAVVDSVAFYLSSALCFAFLMTGRSLPPWYNISCVLMSRLPFWLLLLVHIAWFWEYISPNCGRSCCVHETVAL